MSGACSIAGDTQEALIDGFETATTSVAALRTSSTNLPLTFAELNEQERFVPDIDGDAIDALVDGSKNAMTSVDALRTSSTN